MGEALVYTRPGNFRDLGGLVVDGGVVRGGRVFRSDDVTTADDAFLEGLVAVHGVRQVVDLRASPESARVELSRLTVRGLDYHNVALGGQVMDGYALPAGDDDMAEFYLRLVEQHAHQMVSVLSLIAWSAGGVVFHCAAGKDRTGMLAALLLHALGADDGVVVDDYARTRDNFDAMLERWLTAAPREGDESPHGPSREFLESLDRGNLPPIMGSPASVMIRTLELLDERYEDRLAPLRAAGLDGALIGRLREQLVEPAAG